MSGQVTILQLPTASALTGLESVPVVQNGVTVQTTTSAIAGAGALNYPFLTVGSAAGLNQGRYLSGTAGISLTDNGAGNSLAINLTGTAASLNAASQGFIVKNSASTVTNVQLTVGAGMTIANANGTTGNPLIGLNTNLQNVASLSGIGLVTVNGSTFTQTTLGGTSNQIVVTNGNAGAGAPTFSLANNPVIPGNAGLTLPVGTTAQRSASTGAVRLNSDLTAFEGYNGTSWTQFLTSGVITFSAGTTGFAPSSPTAGVVTLSGILNSTSGGTGASALTGYLYGNGASPATASTTIPNTAISGLGTMSTQNANAVAITGGTINGTSVGATTRSSGDFTTLSGNSVTNTTPVLSFNAANSIASFGSTTANSYNQLLIQNLSNSAGASTNYVISNNLGTDSSYYGEYGMNSSTYSASTPADFYSINNGIYYSGHDGDISIGSGNGFKTYLTFGTSGQSSHVINASGALGFTTNLGTTPALSGTTGFGVAGQVAISGGSSAAPVWGNVAGGAF
jgi:hypothetical protein